MYASTQLPTKEDTLLVASSVSLDKRSIQVFEIQEAVQ